MKLVLKIEMGNAAFADNESQECARILRHLADRIDGHPHFSPGAEQCLHDANGNEVGFAEVVEDSATWTL